MAFKIIHLLFCFNSLKAYTIEILLMILSSIGIILCVLGIIFIPWKVTNSAMEILFIIGLIFIVFSIIIVIIIFYMRIRHKLKRGIVHILLFTNIVMLFICFIALIFFIILAFFTISDLNNQETTTIVEMIELTGEVKNTTIIKNDLTTKSKKIFTIITMVLIIVVLIFLIFLWLSEYIRLYYLTNLSYYDFIKKEKEHVMKHPIQNGLSIIGHDKYGFPVFGQRKNNKFIIKSTTNLNSSGKEIMEKVSIRNMKDKDGKINTKYYAKYSSGPIEKIKPGEKEQYIEKYGDTEDIYQMYDNFGNKTILNFEDFNNSINPGNSF